MLLLDDGRGIISVASLTLNATNKQTLWRAACLSLRIETKTKGINTFHCTEKVVSTPDCQKQMAFVPYVPSVHYIPTSSNSSCRNIISSTSSSYVYSRPLSASHLENVTLCPERQPLNLSDGVNPGLLLITLKLGAVSPNIEENFIKIIPAPLKAENCNPVSILY